MAVLTEVILQFHDTGEVTCCNVTAGEQAQHAAAVQAVTTAMPGATVVSDPWAANTAQQPAQPQVQAPSCQHGPLKIVPGGYSQAKQKAYSSFWACPAPRGQQCQLDQRTLPPIPG